MANNNITKLPRHTLAKMTGGDNQAIKAFENMEFQTLSLPEQVAYLQTALAMAQNDIIYSTRLANEALDAAKSLQRLPPVPVFDEIAYYPSPVGTESMNCTYPTPVSNL